MNPLDKPVLWLAGELKSPPMSREARLQGGYLLRMVQGGEMLSMPESRPMPTVGPRCHELRLSDRESAWRVIYRIDRDAILIAGAFHKKSRKTPRQLIDACRARLMAYDAECP
jgi:phage-related protein